ncbi:MAG: DNA polymerase III subunit delta [Chloroflexota bacterium]
MLYILLGEDDFSRRQALEEIKAGIGGDPSLLATNTTTLEGQPVTPEEVSAASETAPFLAEKRLVIISGLLGRFDPRNGTGRPRKASRAANPPKNDDKAFAACLARIPESTVVVLIDDKVSPGNPLLKALSPRAEVRAFPRRRDADLRQWVQEQVKAQGGSISAPAVSRLAQLVGANLWTMTSEVSKLVLFAGGRRIEEGDVEQIVSHDEEASVFTMVDAILDGKAGPAEALLQRLLARGAAPSYILTMLLRQVQMVVRVKELVGQRQSGPEIQRRLGLNSDYVRRKITELATRYPWARLKGIYQHLLEADLAIKTGKYEGELALNILIAELAASS